MDRWTEWLRRLTRNSLCSAHRASWALSPDLEAGDKPGTHDYAAPAAEHNASARSRGVAPNGHHATCCNTVLRITGDGHGKQYVAMFGCLWGSFERKVVPRGLEPRTLRLLAVRSNQLSYETICCALAILLIMKTIDLVRTQADIHAGNQS